MGGSSRSSSWETNDGQAARRLDLVRADDHRPEPTLEGRDYVCGQRYTMADADVGSQVGWDLSFKSIPRRPAFGAHAERFRQREGYQAAKAPDGKLIEEMQK